MMHIWLNRYIIETTAPLAINSGMRETGFDTQLARDANGLPYIPASSFTGVWRHLVEQQLGESVAKNWFGYITNDEKEKDSLARAPKLSIHHGLLLDSQGKVVLRLIDQQQIAKDPLLSKLSDPRPHYRDHVRINDRGVAAVHAKYDQLLLPKGIRFCVDVRWQGTDDFAGEWQKLEALLTHPHFALGSSTRNGLGRFKIIANANEKLVLQANAQAGKQLVSFANRTHLPTQNSMPKAMPSPFAKLSVKALDAWRSGKGNRPVGKDVDGHTDSFVYSEPYVQWTGNRALWQAESQVILCGSSIKGILAHRIAFHYRRITEQFAEKLEATHEQWQARPDELRQLLGDASQEESRQYAGKLVVEDVCVSNIKPFVRTHTSIDRFTGGVRKGALFSEEVLWQPGFTLILHLATGTKLSKPLKEALEATLTDLQLGLLPLGAGSGRGNSLVEQQAGQEWQIDWSQVELVEEEKSA